MSEQENYLYQKRSSEGAATHHHDRDEKSSTGKTTSSSPSAPLNTSSHRNPNPIAGSEKSTTACDSTVGPGHATSSGLLFGSLARTRQPGFDRCSAEWTT
ncbi:uncharacterized protein PG986_008955 [Apiospora aurea]|uniref:Uncharacterized protein n=1 Tax=Apiospora aurea TaxID=335848 RepID=A0ABR1Q6C6_9PEZI